MLKIYLKKEPRPDDGPKVSLKEFVSLYLNQFYIDMNDILGNYRSIQEHGNRNKIIEFTGKKIKDIELFFMIVKGAYLQRNLHVSTLKRLDYIDQGARMVEMADFIAGMFENMKVSFVPRRDFKMALQVAIDPGKLLIRHSQDLSAGKRSLGAAGPAGDGGETAGRPPIDFEEINRLIRIYLLKEDLQNYEIREGILFVYSEYFAFELALCGRYSSPEWKIINIKPACQNAVLVQHLLKRMPPTIKGITSFVSLYECRKNAQDVFGSLRDEVTGFYQNFSGKIDDALIKGSVRNSRFVCTVCRKGVETTLVNKGYTDIVNIIKEESAPPAGETRKERAHFRDYNSAFFGENHTFFVGSLFLCFSRAEPVFYIGEYPGTSRGDCLRLVLRMGDGRVVGCADQSDTEDRVGDGGSDPLCSQGSAAEIREGLCKSQDYLVMVSDFVRTNREYFLVLYGIAAFCPVRIADGKISSRFFDITSGYTVRYSKHTGDGGAHARTEAFVSGDVSEVVNKATLVHIQRSVPDGFSVIENRIGEKVIFEIHKIQVLLSSVLKTALRCLTEDCRQFNFADGLSFIRNFGALYRYSLLPSTFTMDMLVFDFTELTGECVAITRVPGGYRISGPKTVKVLKISKDFAEEDYRVIGVLYRAHIINRFHRLRKLLQVDGEDKNTLRLPNGSQVVLTPEGLKFFARDGSLDPELTRILNTERNMLGDLRTAGGTSKT